MQQGPLTRPLRVRPGRIANTCQLTLLGIASLFAIGACSQDAAGMNATTGAGAGTGGLAGTAGLGAQAGASGTSSTGTTSAVAGTSAGSGAAPSSRMNGTAGMNSAGSGGMTASAGNSSAGTAGMNGAGASSAAGGGGVADGGTAAPGNCTREMLASVTDSYYVAMAAHDQTKLPLAGGAKFTENGETMQPNTGLWQTAGMLKYKHTALDVTVCTSVSESVVPEGTTDLPVGLRIKLVDGKIAESELIVVRAGDYTVFGSPFPSNTNAIAASKDRVMWETVVPMGERNSREEITGWLERYFKTFPRGGCALADDCQRLENGGGSFECSAALSCEMNASLSGTGALVPRLLIGDVETGIGVGFTMFMGHTDFHMIKMRGGKIYAVHAILSEATSSGWN